VFVAPAFAAPVFAAPVFAAPVFTAPVLATPVLAVPVFAAPVFEGSICVNSDITPDASDTGRRTSAGRSVRPVVASFDPHAASKIPSTICLMHRGSRTRVRRLMEVL
jgi:hypothetical protein